MADFAAGILLASECFDCKSECVLLSLPEMGYLRIARTATGSGLEALLANCKPHERTIAGSAACQKNQQGLG